MSKSVPPYRYARKSRAQLKTLADGILQAHPKRRNGFAVDIEGIIEDRGMEILYRKMPSVTVEAYVARNPKYIIVNEARMHFQPRYRFTLAEELSHRVLESEIWDNSEKKIPAGARVHECNRAQFISIEKDAKALAAEIIEPQDVFIERYEHHYSNLTTAGVEIKTAIKAALHEVAKDLDVSEMAARYRALNLKRLKQATFDRLFPIMF